MKEILEAEGFGLEMGASALARVCGYPKFQAGRCLEHLLQLLMASGRRQYLEQGNK